MGGGAGLGRVTGRAEQVNGHWGDTIKLEFTSIVCFMQRCTDADQLPHLNCT